MGKHTHDAETRKLLHSFLVARIHKTEDKVHAISTTCLLSPLEEGTAEDGHAKRRYDTQHDGHGLPQPDGPRNGRAAQDHRSEDAELHTIGIAVLNAVPAQAVW